MLNLLKLKILTMIVLLNCSISLLASNKDTNCSYLSTGGVVVENTSVKDSVLVSYDDLRLANSKLIELDYEKKINTTLRSIIVNDSIIIQHYKNNNTLLNKSYKKAIRQRNIAIGGGIIFSIVTLLLLLK